MLASLRRVACVGATGGTQGDAAEEYIEDVVERFLPPLPCNAVARQADLLAVLKKLVSFLVLK